MNLDTAKSASTLFSEHKMVMKIERKVFFFSDRGRWPSAFSDLLVNLN